MGNPDILWEILTKRRAIRDFDLNREVPDHLIQKVLEAGTQAPSPENCQPWRYIVIKDPKIKRVIGDKAIGSCIRAFGAQFPKVEVEERFDYIKIKRSRERAHQIMSSGWRMEYIGESPVLIGVVVDQNLLGFDKSTIVGFNAGTQAELMTYVSAGACIQNMWLMASSLGLGMCCHNFELTDFEDEGELTKLLGVPYPRWRIACFLSLGWPARKRELGPPRYPPEKVSFLNTWGNPWRPKRD